MMSVTYCRAINAHGDQRIGIALDSPQPPILKMVLPTLLFRRVFLHGEGTIQKMICPQRPMHPATRRTSRPHHGSPSMNGYQASGHSKKIELIGSRWETNLIMALHTSPQTPISLVHGHHTRSDISKHSTNRDALFAMEHLKT